MDFYTFNELIKITGKSRSTLDKWEKDGLLFPHHKTKKGHRRYSEKEVNVIIEIDSKNKNKLNLSEEDICKIKKMYKDENLSTKQIATFFNISKRTVNKILKSTGIKLRQKPNYDEITKEVLIEYYINKRLSIEQVAEILGCSSTLIEKRLKKFDIKTRSKKLSLHFTPEELKEKFVKNSGANHYNWKGGITPLNEKIRIKLQFISNERMKMDKYICQKCSKKGGNLHVHHKKPFSIIMSDIYQENEWLDLNDMDSVSNFIEIAINDNRLLDINNLITFCEDCHERIHKNLPPLKPVEAFSKIEPKTWKNFVKENHFNMSIKEMSDEIFNNYNYKIPFKKIIRYMIEEGFAFSFENKEWLSQKIKEKSFKEISREFISINNKDIKIPPIALKKLLFKWT